MAYSSSKRLYKSTEYRILTGVAAGIADYLNISHSSIRFLFILLSFASGLGFFFYITLAVLLPTEDEVNAQEDSEFYYNLTHGIVQPEIYSYKSGNFVERIISPPNILALIVVFIGSFSLQFNLVPWELIPDSLWLPGVLISIGSAFIIKSLTTQRKKI
ncbi:MAG: hypothetical protein RLZZ223_560 [Candidatus Parcubacteria bacterium]|jgi:phage shock protein PspC (stress-responsive transcriptional regulator)